MVVVDVVRDIDLLRHEEHDGAVSVLPQVLGRTSEAAGGDHGVLVRPPVLPL